MLERMLISVVVGFDPSTAEMAFGAISWIARQVSGCHVASLPNES